MLLIRICRNTKQFRIQNEKKNVKHEQLKKKKSKSIVMGSKLLSFVLLHKKLKSRRNIKENIFTANL